MENNCLDCANCAEEKRPESVPYIVYEESIARSELHIKRLWIALIIAVSLIFASNIGWLIYESQFDTYSYDYSQDGEGVNIIGDENEVYDEPKAENQNQEKEEPQNG